MLYGWHNVMVSTLSFIYIIGSFEKWKYCALQEYLAICERYGKPAGTTAIYPFSDKEILADAVNKKKNAHEIYFI